MARHLAAIYLNDHLAGSTAVINLVNRAAREHAGTELGTFLEDLAVEIAEDRLALRQIMAAAGARPQGYKLAIARALELAGRLKLNGRIVRRSPLTPFIELEAIAIGIHGKLLGWRALRAATGSAEIGGQRLDGLSARAERQHAIVERHRLDLARRVLPF